MIRFTKHNGEWALTGPESELTPGAAVTVSRSNGEQQIVVVGSVISTDSTNGTAVASIQSRPRVNLPRQYRSRYAAGGNYAEGTPLNPVLALLSQAEALLKQAALMDPAPADQERKFFADLTDAMKDFKKSRAVKAAQSA